MIARSAVRCPHCGLESPGTAPRAAAAVQSPLVMETGKKSHGLRNVILIGMGIFFLAAIGALMDADKPGSSSSSSSPAARPVEYNLAVIDAHGYVAEDDISVARFRRLLSQLSEKYTATPLQIGDQTVTAQNLLKKRGIQESLLNIMTAMNQLWPGVNKKQDYAGALSIYTQFRDQGESNDEATESLENGTRAMGD